jgi:hypothetical protein
MLEARRPVGRLFYLLLSVLGLVMLAQAAGAGPAMTTITDVVFRADECLNSSIWAKTSQP